MLQHPGVHGTKASNCRVLALSCMLAAVATYSERCFALDQQVHNIISETAPLSTAHKLHEKLTWHLLQAQKALLGRQRM